MGLAVKRVCRTRGRLVSARVTRAAYPYQGQAVAAPRSPIELGIPSEPVGVVRSAAYQARASVPGAPAWAQSNSLVTAVPVLTRTGADQDRPSSVENA